MPYRAIFTSLSFVGAVLGALVVAADAQVAVAPQTSRWAVAVYLGSSVGSPARDLEAAMTSAGYTQSFGGCDFFGCVPTRPSPESYSHANPALLGVRYQLRGRWSAELLWGRAASGTTSGRSSSEIIDIEYGGTVLAPLVSVTARRARIGVGPGLLQARWDYRNTSDGSVDRVTTRSLGWLGSAAFTVPIRSSFYLEATAQYRGFATPAVRPARAGRPSGAARVSHAYLAAGVGLTL